MTIIGIDLGTSNSAAAVLRGGRPVIIPSTEGISLGGKAFPSYVALGADGQLLVGEPARRQAVLNPEGTGTAFKRKMGQRVKLKLRDREFSPEELSAFLLQKIKRDAEAFLGEPVVKAVVTVPAYFDDNQRSATKDAARIAGLEVVRLVNEPTAAALAYGLDRLGQELRVAVIDLGGGTLDVTVMELGKGVFEVRATSGDTQLGGTDMNRLLVNSLAERFKLQTGFDIRGDVQASARLAEAAEIAKIELTTSVSTRINLPFIAVVGGGPAHLDLELTRAELERIVHPVVERCRAPLEQALRDAHVTVREIDRLVFVGGPTRMPVVRAFFEDIFGRRAEMGVDPMECVAAGAAIQAGVIEGAVGEILLVDVTPLTLGVETLGGVATALIARNTPVPVRKTDIFTTAADMQTSVTIHVFQGERPMARDNTPLGDLTQAFRCDEDDNMKALIILNDPPYGTEKTYNALRLAHALLKKDPNIHLRVFLMADAVTAARAGQKTPEGFYNIERMLERVIAAKGRVLLCGTCMDARALEYADVVEGAIRSTMDELAAETHAADKVLVF